MLIQNLEISSVTPTDVWMYWSPDQILVNLFVWMPSWPGVWKPVIRITNGGVHSPIIHHLHSPVSLVGQLSRDFVLEFWFP